MAFSRVGAPEPITVMTFKCPLCGGPVDVESAVCGNCAQKQEEQKEQEKLKMESTLPEKEV